jgi:hypothetical protein
VLASNAVYRGFNARSGQTKVYEIGICGFTAKHAVQKGKSVFLTYQCFRTDDDDYDVKMPFFSAMS